MKAWAGVLSLCLVLGACSKSSSNSNNIIEYQMKGNQYSVIVVQDGGLSQSEAKQAALKKAAQMTQNNSRRYFVVESEGAVQAMRSSGSGSNSQMPSNLYYEMVQSGNYGRENFESRGGTVPEIYPAYRIMFKMYEEKPSRSAIDSCTLVDCKK